MPQAAEWQACQPAVKLFLPELPMDAPNVEVRQTVRVALITLLCARFGRYTPIANLCKLMNSMLVDVLRAEYGRLAAAVVAGDMQTVDAWLAQTLAPSEPASAPWAADAHEW